VGWFKADADLLSIISSIYLGEQIIKSAVTGENGTHGRLKIS
jgi:hypothetical protein